jgi:hypothetical protein
MLICRARLLLLPFAFGILLIGCAPSPKEQVPAQASISVWENKLVRRPGDAPEDGKIYIVKDGKKHWIIHSSYIGAHSADFSTNVQTIPATELDRIPPGEPIDAAR